MRLKSVKLAGFKSFVDPTSIALPANLIGVVGPNGCGKSNIIDAVRWVLGETSAKNLRGDSMADVIFSGSTGRKPVGKASVELLFDNSEGKAPGPYAQYAEISVRREVTRDGLSEYYLNKTKCRRKDITDVFLGTGLGPRTYSIIEQGMVTRIIEGKPEDMRSFVEEAAGISKYKERRRETETRIRHTRENLERVEDIRNELDTQLKRLQRQSKAAARYKELKQEERQVHAELLTLRWQELSGRIEDEDRSLAKLQNELESRKADQRGVETAIESLRQDRGTATDEFNTLQGEFYRLGAEVANVEQAIEHARDTLAQRKTELEQAEQALGEASRHLEVDRQRVNEYREKLEASGPDRERCESQWNSASAALAELEKEKDEWQSAWEAFARMAAQPVKEQEVQGARIQQLEQTVNRNRERVARLSEEFSAAQQELAGSELDSMRTRVGEIDSACSNREQQIEQLEQRIRESRRNIEELGAELDENNGRLQTSTARRASLEELQSAALGNADEQLNDWLARHRLGSAPRLAAGLKVEPGWEPAVERLLGPVLGAVCVESLEQASRDLDGLAGSSLCLVELGNAGASGSGERRRLVDVVQSGDVDLTPFLGGVYVADSFEQAMAMRARLGERESIVTRSGALVGRNWLSLVDEESARVGMLARENELERLQEELPGLEREVGELRQRLQREQEVLEGLEQERDDHRRELSGLTQQRAGLHSEFGRFEARFTQLGGRRDQLQRELDELKAEIAREEQELQSAREILTTAKQEVTDFEGRRQSLMQEKETILRRLEQARGTETAARDARHRQELQQENLRTSLRSTEESIERLDAQVRTLSGRREELRAFVQQGDAPELELKKKLEALLQTRLGAEDKLTSARKRVSDVEAAMREREQERVRFEHRIQETRELLEQARMARQELVVRRETLEEQIGNAGYKARELRESLPEDASEADWQARLEELDKKINRIGPVNLVAIEEFKEQSERKAYLDKQYEDLSQALGMLEDAMRKIDRETRTRFKETFDQVNANFQQFFPRLFGGGHAYLELTGDDLLSAGVTVMARPPGKRNSTIHLLSGGEKALTAVSLMFAFFELNPAPFCLLDEVDAPLDDANVERYSETLRALAQRSQMIFITHNKISMEAADVLIGVTMSEPGVSRLVAVDLAQAVELATQ